MDAARTPRLEDVAARAGVSTATVSRYINSPERVALATRERIRSAVEEIRRNIEAAGFEAVERDGRFVLVP